MSILTPYQEENCRASLGRIREEFGRRYPQAYCSIYATLHGNGTNFKFEVAHLQAGHCTLGRGPTIDEAFADLDSQLAEIHHEPTRKRAQAQKLIAEAEALEASLVLRDLQTSNQLPVSSPA